MIETILPVSMSNENKKIIKLFIHNDVDRKNLLAILGQNGIKTWQEERMGERVWREGYYICFEYNE